MELAALIALAAIVFAATGCSAPPPCIDGGCELVPDDQVYRDAMVAVHALYNTQQAVPALTVYSKGDCSASVPIPTGAKSIPGGKINVVAPEGGYACVYGAWFPDTNAIYMTTLDWQNTIAHELLHQKLMERDGDADYGHTKPEWKTWLPAAVELIS